MFWNKKLFQAAGLTEPPKRTVDDFVEESKKIAASGQGKYGYCLRGGPGALNGCIMFMLTQMGSNEFFDEEGNSTFNEPEAVKGLQILVDMYKNGYAPKDSGELGLQRDRRRLLFRHLRDARPGSGRADRRGRADEARRLRRGPHAGRAGQ